MRVGELTNNPGARNKTRERVNGALHELDMSVTLQNDCFGWKRERSRRKRAGSTTGAARYTQVEHLQSGGRVQRPNLSSLTVYLQSCHSYILAQPMASIGVRLQARQSDRRSCPLPSNSTPQRYCRSSMRSPALSAPLHSLFYVHVMTPKSQSSTTPAPTHRRRRRRHACARVGYPSTAPSSPPR